MELKIESLSWLVLSEDKDYLVDIARKEGKQKWKVFNEMRVALEEKRAREARILENANEQRETGINADNKSYKIHKQDNGNGQGEVARNRPGIFGWRRPKVQRSNVGDVQDAEL